MMKVGNIFILTSGSYSDYGIDVTLRVTKEFDFDQAKRTWIIHQPTNTKIHQFVEFLLTNGWCEEIIIPNLHIGDYGAIDRDADPVKMWAESHEGSMGEQWLATCLEHEDCVANPELGLTCYQTRPRQYPKKNREDRLGLLPIPDRIEIPPQAWGSSSGTYQETPPVPHTNDPINGKWCTACGYFHFGNCVKSV